MIKDVVGYEGIYTVSDEGKVYSVKKGIEIAQRYDRYGYLRVSLSKQGKIKTHLVHSLVAQAFVPNPENKETVNHIDENKENNRADNLEWLTRSENIRYGTRGARAAKSKMIPVRCIETGETFESGTAADAALNVSTGCVLLSIKRNGTCKGYHFEYIEKEDK